MLQVLIGDRYLSAIGSAEECLVRLWSGPALRSRPSRTAKPGPERGVSTNTSQVLIDCHVHGARCKSRV